MGLIKPVIYNSPPSASFSSIFFVIFTISENFKSWKFGMVFLGVNFWSREFFCRVLLEALRILLGLYFCPYLIIPVT